MPRNVMACVTQQKTCERLIRKAAEINKKEKGSLYVIHVTKDENFFLGNTHEGEALEYLFGISKLFGANLHVVKSNDVIKSIADFSKNNNVGIIVIGESPEPAENKFHMELQKMLNNVDIRIIPQPEK